MRKVIFFLLSLNLFLEAESQKAHPKHAAATEIDKFIMSPMVQWAYYSSDTLQLNNYDLVTVLMDRISKNEIKAARTPEYNRTSSFELVKNSTLHKNSVIVDTLMVYDGESYQYKQTVSKREFACDTGVIRTLEIYYVSGEKLNAFVPWINILAPVYTSVGEYLGRSNYASLCINTDIKFTDKLTDKLYFINVITKKLKLDSLKKEDQLKEMFGKNLIETLWAGVLTGSNKLIALSPVVGSITQAIQYPESKNLSVAEINDLSYGGASVAVPVYDSIGNILGSKNVGIPLTPSIITSVEVKENWFYDYTANKMVCKIPEIILLVNADRVLKIIF